MRGAWWRWARRQRPRHGSEHQPGSGASGVLHGVLSGITQGPVQGRDGGDGEEDMWGSQEAVLMRPGVDWLLRALTGPSVCWAGNGVDGERGIWEEPQFSG